VIGIGSVTNPALVTNHSYTLTYGAMVTQAAAANTGTATIGAAAGTNVTNNYSVTFTSPTTFDVTNTSAVPPVAVLSGQTYTSGSPISFNGVTFNITGAPAAGDVFNLAPNSFTVTDNTTGLPVPGIIPYVSGQQISLNGMQFDIQGTPASGDQFTINPSTNVSIFKTISDLITTLNTPVTSGNAAQSAALTNSLRTAMNNLDRGLNNVLTANSAVGASMKEIDTSQTTGDSLGVSYQKTLSQLQDTDVIKAASDLARQSLALQAAQKSFMQVANLSLFNYM
jgi:flagellar hook-associated protein 3 FlgL